MVFHYLRFIAIIALLSLGSFLIGILNLILYILGIQDLVIIVTIVASGLMAFIPILVLIGIYVENGLWSKLVKLNSLTLKFKNLNERGKISNCWPPLLKLHKGIISRSLYAFVDTIRKSSLTEILELNAGPPKYIDGLNSITGVKSFNIKGLEVPCHILWHLQEIDREFILTVTDLSRETYNLITRYQLKIDYMFDNVFLTANSTNHILNNKLFSVYLLSNSMLELLKCDTALEELGINVILAQQLCKSLLSISKTAEDASEFLSSMVTKFVPMHSEYKKESFPIYKALTYEINEIIKQPEFIEGKCVIKQLYDNVEFKSIIFDKKHFTFIIKSIISNIAKQLSKSYVGVNLWIFVSAYPYDSSSVSIIISYIGDPLTKSQPFDEIIMYNSDNNSYDSVVMVGGYDYIKNLCKLNQTEIHENISDNECISYHLIIPSC